MICPSCGSEYRDGYTRCADCDVALIEAPPPETEPPDVPLVKVYESGDPAVIPVIQSVLQGAGIEFMAKGEPIQELFGGRSCVVGPVEFYVRQDDAEAARSLMQTLELAAPVADETDPQ